MFEYNIHPDNSSKQFIETCNKICKELKSAKKDKMLIDVDGTTIQKISFGNKNIYVYDDYDIGAVFVKSEIPLNFLR